MEPQSKTYLRRPYLVSSVGEMRLRPSRSLTTCGNGPVDMAACAGAAAGGAVAPAGFCVAGAAAAGLDLASSRRICSGSCGKLAVANSASCRLSRLAYGCQARYDGHVFSEVEHRGSSANAFAPYHLVSRGLLQARRVQAEDVHPAGLGGAHQHAAIGRPAESCPSPSLLRRAGLAPTAR